MNKGQLANLRGVEGAPLTLVRRSAAGVPHEVIGDEHPAPFKRLQEGHRATFANEWCRTIYLDHRKPSAGSRNGVTFFCVRLLLSAQCIQLRLEGAPINYSGRSRFISYEVCHCFLLSSPRLCFRFCVGLSKGGFPCGGYLNPLRIGL